MSNTTSTPQPSPPGWYPVDNQQDRYWDGTGWSDQVRPRQAPTPPHSPSSDPASPHVTPTAQKSLWYRRGWVIGVAAGLFGLTVGVAAAAADPTSSQEYQELASTLNDVRDELTASEDALAATEDEVAASQEELEAAVGDLPAREDAVDKAEAAVAKREKAVTKAEKQVKATEKALLKREQKVGIVEKEIAKNTIPGDGLFEVGVDMKPGTYKTQGAGNCYYAVLGDANGNNIKSNNITSGPAIVAVATGEYFESTRCADWVFQR